MFTSLDSLATPRTLNLVEAYANAWARSLSIYIGDEKRNVIPLEKRS